MAARSRIVKVCTGRAGACPRRGGPKGPPYGRYVQRPPPAKSYCSLYVGGGVLDAP